MTGDDASKRRPEGGIREVEGGGNGGIPPSELEGDTLELTGRIGVKGDHEELEDAVQLLLVIGVGRILALVGVTALDTHQLV